MTRAGCEEKTTNRLTHSSLIVQMEAVQTGLLFGVWKEEKGGCKEKTVKEKRRTWSWRQRHLGAKKRIG